MKQLKFLMVAFTLLMGVSFTSCLNDDAGESMYDGIGYVRTVMGSYFVDLYGNTYHPTMASVTEMEAQGFKMSGTDLAQIAFKYVEDTPATKAEGSTFTPQDYRIKLVSAIAVDSYSTKHVSSVENMEMEAIPETAPIVTLEPTDNYGQTYKPWMYGAEMLVLPISWKMEKKEEMLKQHTMELVYINDESNESSTELVFYLRHNKGTDTKTDVFVVFLSLFPAFSALSLSFLMEKIVKYLFCIPFKADLLYRSFRINRIGSDQFSIQIISDTSQFLPFQNRGAYLLWNFRLAGYCLPFFEKYFFFTVLGCYAAFTPQIDFLTYILHIFHPVCYQNLTRMWLLPVGFIVIIIGPVA